MCLGVRDQEKGMRYRAPSRLWWLLLLLSATGCLSKCTSGSDLPGDEFSANKNLSAHSVAAPAPLPLKCPSSGALAAQTSPGERIVILSWTASVPSPAGKVPSGYCVYRSRKDFLEQFRPSQSPPCHDCELV